MFYAFLYEYMHRSKLLFEGLQKSEKQKCRYKDRKNFGCGSCNDNTRFIKVLFKKKHDEWETKRKKLYSHIEDIENKKMELYEELEHLMDEVYDTKKEPSTES